MTNRKKEARRRAEKIALYRKTYPYNFTTREILKDILYEEGFTKDEVKYAIKKADINWRYQALFFIYTLKERFGKKKKKIKKELKNHGFTKKEIKEGMEEYGL